MKFIFYLFIFPVFCSGQSFLKKETIKNNQEILNIKFSNDFPTPVIEDLFRKSYFNNRYCNQVNENKICKIPVKYYIEKATCLINKYQFQPEDFLRLASEKDFDKIFKNEVTDDYIYITSNFKNSNYSLKNFPKCYKSHGEFIIF